MVGGHAFALLLGKGMIYDLGYHWVTSLFTFTMIYLFTGIVTCFFVPEKKIDFDGEDENLTTGQKICSIMKTMKVYYGRKASNIILLVEYCFIDSQSAMVVYWVPFFFMQMGFGYTAIWIALSYPAGQIFGSLTLIPLVNHLNKKFIPIATSIILLL